MTPKQLAKLIVQYHTTKKDNPDPKCGFCSGTGIETWYCGHNGNEEKSICKCMERSRRLILNELSYHVNASSKEILTICKAYLKKDEA